jgi:gliding motility-associated-like protein
MKTIFTLYILLNAATAVSQTLQIHGETEICMDDEIKLYATGDSVYAWANAKYPTTILSHDSTLVYNPDESGTYFLYTPNDTLQVFIHVKAELCYCRYYVPNIFTPDGNERNDEFIPIVNCDIEGHHLTIYNRTGEVMFDSHEIQPRWNGTYLDTGVECKPDVYVWQGSYLRSDGVLVHEVGHVLLAR